MAMPSSSASKPRMPLEDRLWADIPRAGLRQAEVNCGRAGQRVPVGDRSR
jgi:hypothetical protein